jgi:nitrogen fixation protein
MLFSTIICVAGFVYWGGNSLARRGFARQLRELDAQRQLPEARVVIR